MNDQYVFYLDDNNILHDQYDTGNGDYKHGTLAGLRIQCAHYSALAAVTIKGQYVYQMVVFFQAPTSDGAVNTSLTAVPPRTGILGRGKVDAKNEGQPIYYLQMDNNAVGSGQGEAGMNIILLRSTSASDDLYHRTAATVRLRS